ncbi:hypothetical protein PG637_09185 [Riemerella anatipestifer]|nr:hypothetical protein [Riemerella anatipestifer]MDY3325837.1 hypothetical protein [Riemerella anatipestifer]MDY3354379.1 hypothetical protein [Riemerella anatipestifer]
MTSILIIMTYLAVINAGDKLKLIRDNQYYEIIKVGNNNFFSKS